MNALDHNTGIEVHDLISFEEFRARPAHERSIEQQLASMRRIARVFAASPEEVLQELVEIAGDLCHADSAGVSLETEDSSGNPVFQWAAIAGDYSRFLNAMLPRDWMPCGICVDTMRPQHVRVPVSHFAAMGVQAEPITDGMLIPWEVSGTRGTIWILAHGRSAAFNHIDYQLMQSLADFAMMAVRHQAQQKTIIQQASAAAAAAVAHRLAHKINNPLQSITNSIFLAEQETSNPHLQQASSDLRDLSAAVTRLLCHFVETKPDVKPDRVTPDQQR